jgi:hypothetical protein
MAWASIAVIGLTVAVLGVVVGPRLHAVGARVRHKANALDFIVHRGLEQGIELGAFFGDGTDIGDFPGQ